MENMTPAFSPNQVASQIYQVMQKGQMTRAERLGILKQILNQDKDFDEDYLNAVFFPEDSLPVRIPSKFGLPSALFTDRYSFYLNTNANGKGWVGIAPFALEGFSAYIPNTAYDGTAGVDTTSAGAPGRPFKPITESYNTGYHMNYAQVRLVGCSVRMQYIGTAEEEAGLLIGSHVHDSSPTVMTDEIIENGFFVSRGRPNEGMRLVYIPRDQGDLEFFENSHLINLKSLTFVNVGNWNNPTNEYAIEDPTDTTTTSEHVAEGNLAKYCVKDVFGLGTKKIQGTQPYQLVISWTGMKPSQTWLRVDVERHFEGIPRLSIRDYVSTERPTENERSINFIRKHAHKLPLASMKMTDKSLVKAIRNNMANIGDMMDGGIGQLLKSGSGMGLGELAAGLSGQIGSPGLIENINKYGGTLMRGGSSIGNIIGTFT